MKVNITVEATAQEMRDFLGLPNIKPMQDKMLDNMRIGIEESQANLDPMGLMKPMFPAQLQTMEMLQRMFWEAFQKAEQKNHEDGNQDSPTEKD
jgi:hypothetical protein